ncbi:MAG: calcium-binding protein [Candidatus Dadabacteria bacterium]|nr:calcium-binding protein [Candidatus Dadabacteria bacterium]
MRLRNLFMILLLCMTVGILGTSCTGDDGAQGPPGPQGPPGEQGEPGMDITSPDSTSEEGCEEFVERIRFSGTSGDDIICGNERGNVINGEEGDDIIFGREGNDRLNGNDGDDTLHGGPGDDTLRGNEGEDDLNGDAGKDDLHGGNGDDIMDGGDGDDTFWSFAETDGSDDFVGGGGTDVVNFSMLGLDPSDTDPSDGTTCLTGDNAPSVTVSLAVGYTEFMDGTEIAATDYYDSIENLVGTCGSDTLTGDGADNNIMGERGDDTINGGGGDDTIDAGAGQSEGTLNGGDGMDILVVGAASSLADGSGDAARASNFEGLAVRAGTTTAVSLTAAASGSTLVAGSPAGDTLVGGAGKDTFVITKGVGAVTITGFGTTAGSTDILVLKGYAASASLTRGTTNSTQLLLGGNVIATVGDEAAAAIVSAPSTFVVRQD